MPSGITAYYNENDEFCCAWLSNLMDAGVITPGKIDNRSIHDVKADDFAGYTRQHFFAGIGVWDHALNLAGWGDARVMSGSCPCQPFSNAGQHKGFSDPRHLWPEWFRLICESRPQRIIGEQVSSALAWFDLVSGDLENKKYSVGAAIVGAHSVSAPHIRQRLYWVAKPDEGRRGPGGEPGMGRALGEHTDVPAEAAHPSADGRRASAVADPGRQRRQQVGGSASGDEEKNGGAGRNGGEQDGDYVFGGDGKVGGASGLGMGEPHGAGPQPWQRASEAVGHGRAFVAAGGLDKLAEPEGAGGRPHGGAVPSRPAEGLREPQGEDERRAVGEAGRLGHRLPTGELGHAPLGGNGAHDGERFEGRGREGQAGGPSFWSDCDWLPCIDGKARCVEPGTFPLAYGSPNRVGRLRGYGNALVAPQAAAFIRACIEAIR